MRVGICCPYHFGERTALAIRLACALRKSGRDPVWLAPTITPNRLHPAWDGQVHGNASLERWARCRMRVWFTLDRTLLQQARRHNRGNDVLVSFQDPPLCERPLFLRFSAIVAANPVLAQRLRETNPDVLQSPWPAGLRPAHRQGFFRPHRIKAVLYLDGPTLSGAEHSRCIQFVCDLASMPDLKLTVVLGKPLTVHQGQALRAAGVRYDVRPTLPVFLAQLSVSDWFLYPLVTHRSCFFASQARALGVPTLGWATQVSQKLLGDDGLLIPATVETGWAGMLEAARRYLPNEAVLRDRQQQCYVKATAEHDEAGFADFWTRLLEPQHV